jgi:hypothetical protein
MGVSGQRHAPAALYSRGKNPTTCNFIKTPKSFYSTIYFIRSQHLPQLIPVVVTVEHNAPIPVILHLYLEQITCSEEKLNTIHYQEKNLHTVFSGIKDTSRFYRNNFRENPNIPSK